jgi:hypothetical protein
MAFDVNQFRAAMIGDGARPNLFQVQMNFPNFVGNSSAAQVKSAFLINASTLPESNLGTVPQFYFGREVKFAGNRTYSQWTVSVINDEDFAIRTAFERWVDAINSPIGSLRDVRAAVLDGGYGRDAKVTQYSKTGAPIKIYKFIGLFPVSISPIDVSWGANDQIEEFQVTFDYQYWEDASSDLSSAVALGATVLSGII